MRASLLLLVLTVLGAIQLATCCDFGEDLGKKRLAVAGKAFGSRENQFADEGHTVFVPNDLAFAALAKQLGVTEAMLLTDRSLKGKVISILNNHVLAPEGYYTAATLVGNKTIPTQLGAKGKSPDYSLTFSPVKGTDNVLVKASNSSATTIGKPLMICDRQVFVVDKALLPGDVSKTVVDNVIAASEGKDADDDSDVEESLAPTGQSAATTIAFSTLLFGSCIVAAIFSSI